MQEGPPSRLASPPPRPQHLRDQSVSVTLAIIWKAGLSLSRISSADGVAVNNPITAARRDRADVNLTRSVSYIPEGILGRFHHLRC